MIDLSVIFQQRTKQPTYTDLEKLTLDTMAFSLCKMQALESKIDAMKLNFTALSMAFVFAIADKIVMSLDAYDAITPLTLFMS